MDLAVDSQKLLVLTVITPIVAGFWVVVIVLTSVQLRRQAPWKRASGCSVGSSSWR